MRVAVVGSGIAGLSCAWMLDRNHKVTVFEALPRLGGHSNTLDVSVPSGTQSVDTGFIVYNERNYPNLIAFFDELGVATEPSNMSFGVSQNDGGHEYASTRWRSLFAQRRNLLNPKHYRLLLDILRFNRTANAFLASSDDEAIDLGSWLGRHRFEGNLARSYVLPMAAAIWSAPVETVRAFSARSFLTFFANHGLLTVSDQPRWRTVTGGSRTYVRRIETQLRGEISRGTAVTLAERSADGVVLTTADGEQQNFDRVIFACHADTTLKIVAKPSPAEQRILSAFRFQPNLAILHSDPSLMPKRADAWASWNFITGASDNEAMPVSVTYWMNLLQNIDRATPLFVSLNPFREPDPALVHARITYDHPVFDIATVVAQRQLETIQGEGGFYYAGAWCGFGFHEDGLKSAIAVASRFGVAPPWQQATGAAGGAGLPERAAAAPA